MFAHYEQHPPIDPLVGRRHHVNSLPNLCVNQWDVNPGVADQVCMLEIDVSQVAAKMALIYDTNHISHSWIAL